MFCLPAVSQEQNFPISFIIKLLWWNVNRGTFCNRLFWCHVMDYFVIAQVACLWGIFCLILYNILMPDWFLRNRTVSTTAVLVSVSKTKVKKKWKHDMKKWKAGFSVSEHLFHFNQNSYFFHAFLQFSGRTVV